MFIFLLHLFTMFFSCSLKDNSKFWIIEFTTHAHICFSMQLFFVSFYKIKSVNVSLPNETFVIVQFARNVHFSPHLYMTNVLYPPSFNLNLISISKVCNSFSCNVQFSIDHCYIQYIKSLKMIDLNDQLNNL